MNQLTLDQLAEQSPVATQELIRLRAELAEANAQLKTTLYAKPVPAENPGHWAVMNPGRADQYRAESAAVRKELGLSADSDEVAPIDLLNAIRQIRADRSRITEQDAREILSAFEGWDKSQFMQGTYDGWLKAEGRTLLNKLNADREQVPAVAVPDEWRRIVERAANMMRMSGVVSHKDSLNPLHSWLHDAESLLDAPSHSQQREEAGVSALVEALQADYQRLQADHERLQADHERLQAEFTRELQRRFDGNEQASREHRAEVRVLVEALERIANMDSMSYHSLDSAKITARAAIAAYRKQGGNQ